MGWEKDLPPGEQLVACFRPFLEDLVASDLSQGGNDHPSHSTMEA
jgi:hypothetical protein